MSNEVLFRDIKRSDYAHISKMIGRTWRFDKACPPKIAALAGDMYLHICLKEQNFARVAEKDGIPIGIIMGRAEKLPVFAPLHNMALRRIILKFMLTREGRRIWKLFNSFFSINHHLLVESGRKYSGELVLFIVSQSEKRKGIGKELLALFLEHMHKCGGKDFYLFTDSYCDYEFYDQKGFRRVGERPTELELHPGRKMNFFLYEDEI